MRRPDVTVDLLYSLVTSDFIVEAGYMRRNSVGHESTRPAYEEAVC
jgi:hypothetical protein